MLLGIILAPVLRRIKSLRWPQLRDMGTPILRASTLYATFSGTADW